MNQNDDEPTLAADSDLLAELRKEVQSAKVAESDPGSGDPADIDLTSETGDFTGPFDATTLPGAIRARRSLALDTDASSPQATQFGDASAGREGYWEMPPRETREPQVISTVGRTTTWRSKSAVIAAAVAAAVMVAVIVVVSVLASHDSDDNQGEADAAAIGTAHHTAGAYGFG